MSDYDELDEILDVAHERLLTMNVEDYFTMSSDEREAFTLWLKAHHCTHVTRVRYDEARMRIYVDGVADPPTATDGEFNTYSTAFDGEIPDYARKVMVMR